MVYLHYAIFNDSRNWVYIHENITKLISHEFIRSLTTIWFSLETKSFIDNQNDKRLNYISVKEIMKEVALITLDSKLCCMHAIRFNLKKLVFSKQNVFFWGKVKCICKNIKMSSYESLAGITIDTEEKSVEYLYMNL